MYIQGWRTLQVVVSCSYSFATFFSEVVFHVLMKIGHREFQIGVDIRRGRRQYQHTRVATFVARYQLKNRTQYTLAYLQRHQLQDEVSFYVASLPPPSRMVTLH